jgi:uncharacterized protein (DUF2225 family)
LPKFSRIAAVRRGIKNLINNFRRLESWVVFTSHQLEKISKDEDIQLLHVTAMQELEDSIESLTRSFVLLGIVYRFLGKEGNKQGKNAIKKKVLKDLAKIEEICKEARVEIKTS